MKNGFIKTACCTPEIRVADCQFNMQKILDCIFKAHKEGAKIIAFPELCLTGKTCGDLFFTDTLLCGALDALKEIAEKTKDVDAVISIGFPLCARGKIYNCCGVLNRGVLLNIVPKTTLSKGEERFFAGFDGEEEWLESLEKKINGFEQCLTLAQKIFQCSELNDLKIAYTLGEDDLTDKLTRAGADIIINMCADFEVVGKAEIVRNSAKFLSKKYACGYVTVNAGDGESTTDGVFSGHNIIAENGKILAESKLFENGIILSEIDIERLHFERKKNPVFSESKNNGQIGFCEFSLDVEKTKLTRKIPQLAFVPESENEKAERCDLILTMQAKGLAKRITHTFAEKVVIGISGGLDSTLAILACVKAMDMLGRPRTDVYAVTMPCFGTTRRTRSNAQILCEELGVTFREVQIGNSVLQHFEDINHNKDDHSVVFENAQARERTQVLMDIANQVNGMVIGTGDLSELALGWATYNGDHMSMYGVNGSIPKTLIRFIVRHYAENCGNETIRKVLVDIVQTPVSPELLPADTSGEIAQKTEDLVGPYELHDFFIYYFVRWGFSPEKIYRLCKYAFEGEYDNQTILHWLKTFFRRFFNQQFKRSCLPDGAKIGSISLSPRGDLNMPSDACSNLWLAQIENLK